MVARRGGGRRPPLTETYAYDARDQYTAIDAFVPDWDATLHYAHDGNKNVTDLFYHTLAARPEGATDPCAFSKQSPAPCANH